MRISKIVIRGERQAISEVRSTETQDDLQLEESFVVRSGTRGASERHEVPLNNDSIVEFVFEDGTTWICNSNTIDEIFPEVTTASRSASEKAEIPLMLVSSDVERGLIGNILLKVVNIFSRKKLTKKVKDLAQDLEMKQLENQVGLFRLDRSFKLQPLIAETSTRPYLLFIHGTATSTKGSFGGLDGTDPWNFIHENYGGRVIAFQHESLTKGPLQNVLELIESLPKNCLLHIITQSHGGLVGELLSRFCNSDQHHVGFGDDEINLLKKSKRTDDVKNIRLIREAIATKNITIEKFIRVACPAGGSTLASRRLDHLLNVLANLITFGTGGVGGAITTAFRNLISAVIEAKNDVDTLPGVEALSPKSPFIEALVFPGSPVEIDNSLIIISGNCKMKVNLKGLLVIATKLFFGEKNDLVVNTDSMYLGTRRKGKVQYFFDEGAEVDHFHYFKNKRTNEALFNALKAKEGETIKDFRVREVQPSEASRGIFGLEIGQVFQNHVSGSRPIVVLLPGIMGSNLAQQKVLIWIDYLKFLGGDLRKLDITTKNIDAPSLVKTSYGKIVRHLSLEYDVVTFPYDWRLPLTESAAKFSNTIEALLKFNQPIKVIGHSMGGVLVRDFMVYQSDTWEKLNRSAGFRLIFLGAPLGGAFRIPSVLFGHDGIIDKLSKIDIFHTKKELVKIFSRLPGILSLLPHSSEHDFSDPDTWEAMRAGIDIPDWPVPAPEDLKAFGKYRDKIHKALDDIDFRNVVYIAGRDRATTCGYRVDDGPAGKELVFLSTAEGDQSVTWESGIPSRMIKSDSVYYVDVSHGSLANEPSMFEGISELLTNGFTNLLSRVRPTVRGDQKLFRSPELIDFDLTPEGVENSILGIKPGEKVRSSQHLLKLSVCNGDLKYATYPVLCGHFTGDGILYAEKAIDFYLKGALSERHRLGLYPGPVGSSEVMLSFSKDDFRGAVIVGLGDFGTLTAFQLAKSVEQGTCNYLLQLNNKHAKAKLQPGITSLIIGCGYGGLSIESSINAVASGVNNANNKISKLYGDRAQLINNLEFVEQDRRKALSCLYALYKIEKNSDQSLAAVLEKKIIVEKPGLTESYTLDSGIGWWTRITVKRDKKEKGNDKLQHLIFNISTGGSREEQRSLQTSRDIIDQLLKEISVENNWSLGKARTIFELLIPNDFKEQVKKQNNIVWVLDEDTAAFPWELLQDSVESGKPLAINAGMVRQLVTEDYRIKINAVNNTKALVIGDPELGGMISQLPGAYKEAQVVSSLLSAEGFETTPMLKSSSGQIIEALFSAEYKIIHLAGHGVYDPERPEHSGMVIGNNAFLTTGEISQMSSVPELVFVNCCHLGKVDGGDERYYQNRNKLAANIGVQLIQNGVKAVIAAGWAVDDSKALKFTEVFYKSMFEDCTFGDAVRKARAAIYEDHATNTWGAYQCYGDQFYKFREFDAGTGKKKYSFVTSGEALIELANLHSEIETNNWGKDVYLDRLVEISKVVDESSLRDYLITEKEAMIYADLYEYVLAISKFENLRAENVSFSPPAMERYCSIRVKQYVLDFAKAPKDVNIYIKKIDDVVQDFNSMLRLGATPMRYAGLGATFKRKSILLPKVQKGKAYVQTALFYQLAYAAPNNPYKANSFANWIEAEHVLVLLGQRKWGDSAKTSGRKAYRLPASLKAAAEDVTSLRDALANMPPDKMDYRDLVGHASLELCLHLLEPKSASADALLDIYKNIWKKAGSIGKRSSEIEHFDFLIDAYGQVPKTKRNGALTVLQHLKTELLKLV
ncbi:CHAT domain-containing protein [Chryseolinea sp. T2]|uniref:CHAT domain-containing protein n=1 Tax=Chryseolinea sp. T2 TaxID=3129255 RepID=UPI0030776C41